MADRLEGVRGIESAVGQRDVHVVGQQEIACSADPVGPLQGPPAALDLVGVEVQACDAGARQPGDVDQRPAHAAAHIDGSDARPETQQLGDAGFLPTLRCMKALPELRGAKCSLRRGARPGSIASPPLSRRAAAWS